MHSWQTKRRWAAAVAYAADVATEVKASVSQLHQMLGVTQGRTKLQRTTAFPILNIHGTAVLESWVEHFGRAYGIEVYVRKAIVGTRLDVGFGFRYRMLGCMSIILSFFACA